MIVMGPRGLALARPIGVVVATAAVAEEDERLCDHGHRTLSSIAAAIRSDYRREWFVTCRGGRRRNREEPMPDQASRALRRGAAKSRKARNLIGKKRPAA